MFKYSYFMDGCMFLILVLYWARGYAQVSCPNGDTAGIVSGAQTCTELVTSSTALSCYDTAIETACCSSCNALNTGVTDCEYGDRDACFSFFCATLVNIADCCETCASSTSTVTTITTTVPTTSTTSLPTTITDTTITTTIPTTVTTITTTDPTTATSALTTTLPPATTTPQQVTIATTTDPATTISSGSASSQSSVFLGEGTNTEENKDAAIIGGIIGGVAGLLLIIGAVVLCVYYWNKLKHNKVRAMKTESLPPKSDRHKVPDVILPMEPVNQLAVVPGIGNQTVSEHSIQRDEKPRTVLYENESPSQVTDSQLPGNQGGQTVVRKPHLLPPLDVSSLNSNELISGTGQLSGPGHVNQLYDNVPDAVDSIDNIVKQDQNAVKFLVQTDSIFPNKK